jgi:hypothetical protein
VRRLGEFLELEATHHPGSGHAQVGCGVVTHR